MPSPSPSSSSTRMMTIIMSPAIILLLSLHATTVNGFSFSQTRLSHLNVDRVGARSTSAAYSLNSVICRISNRPSNNDNLEDDDTRKINVNTNPPINTNINTPGAMVNAATLRFNNKLNIMSKSVDATTAPKVEKMLMDALESYQLYLKYNSNPQEDEQTQQQQQQQQQQQIIIPNTFSFTNAISAWARCTRKDSAQNAQALLDKMLSLYKQGVVDNGGDDNGGGACWKHVKPNKVCYNLVITAWARSRERGSGQKAEELLRSKYEFYVEDGSVDEDLKPDSRSFNVSFMFVFCHV